MSGLIVGSDCSSGIDEIRSENENNWIIFGYVGRTNELKVMDKGSGGLEEFVENLNDGHIMFGYLSFAINQTFKYLFVSWCGEGVEGMRKGLFNNHTKDFENWLGKPGRGFHLQINARTEGDLDEAIVLDKLNKVSSFIKASSLKSAAQDKEQLKQQSSQYWQKEKQQDEERKNVMQSHVQAQQQTLAAAKDAEQKRLAQQAKSTLSTMEQQRNQNAADFKAREEERTQAQTKLQEDKKTQIFADQQRTKAAQYVPVDASHGQRAAAPAPVRSYKPPAPAASSADASAGNVPAPIAGAKKAPGRIAVSSAFNQPPPAAAPKPGPARPFKPAPAPVVNKPAPPPVASKPKPPPVAAKPVYTPEPVYQEPEPAYEEPAYQEEPAYAEPAYEEPAQEQYQEQYQEPAYEEPAYAEPAYEEPAYEEPAYTEPAYAEPAYEEPAQQEWEAQPAEGEQQYEQTYEETYYTQAKALYDYAAETENDLSFNEGDIITILEDQDPSGWWKGDLNGAQGFFPSNFVERL